jgi:hypothetical protein
VKAKIKFRLTPDGKVHWDNIENVGSSCTKVIDDVSSDLGLHVETLGPTTPAFYEEVQQDNEQDITT